MQCKEKKSEEREEMQRKAKQSKVKELINAVMNYWTIQGNPLSDGEPALGRLMMA